jgi:uncharacterized protein (DUF362 family)
MHSNRFTRRTFLGGTIGLCAGTVFLPKVLGLNADQEQAPLGCRQRIPNPWVENGKPVVAVVRGVEFAAMLAKGLELLGGFARLGTGKPVMVKPNFIFPEPYPETTDGASILKVVETLQREGFADITVADSGSGMRPASYAFDFYSLPEKAAAGAFKLIDLAQEKVKVVTDNRWTAMNNLEVHESAYHAPLIVNMPVIKQHQAAQFTCALKNSVGVISGVSRRLLHRSHERATLDSETILKNMKTAIAEASAAFNPEITIIDARQVMGKSHHRSSGGELFDGGRIIISGDMLAADRVAAHVLAELYSGFEVSMTDETFNHAAALGLGVNDLNDMVIKEVSI